MRLAIRTTDLSKSYGSQGSPNHRRRAADPLVSDGAQAHEILALDRLNLDVEEGEFFGLLGRNGAGKTTTIGMLTTRLRASSGSAYVAGFDVGKNPTHVKQLIGVVPQRANADHGLTVEENLQFHAAYFALGRTRARRRTHELLERFELTICARRHVVSLSTGQQQRLMIARALMHDPAILFLDEPTVGLDPAARQAFWQLLAELHDESRTIVMTTHYMEEAEALCQRVAILDRGRLVGCDTPRALIERVHAETKIVFAFAVCPDRLTDQVRNVEGVSHASVEGDEIHLSVINAAPVIAAVALLASNAQLRVRDIRVIRPGLDAVFIGMTQRGVASE